MLVADKSQANIITYSTTSLCSTRCILRASAASALACRAAASWASIRSLLGYPAAGPRSGNGDAFALLCCGLLSGSESSENIRPIDDNGFWIDRSSPATGAFSSSFVVAGPASRLCVNLSVSADARGVAWALDVSDSAFIFSCAIADTAASTFFSNSSSLTVKLVRSRVSMNWIAPDYTPSDIRSHLL